VRYPVVDITTTGTGKCGIGDGFGLSRDFSTHVSLSVLVQSLIIYFLAGDYMFEFHGTSDLIGRRILD
jgi:hypothetical protein